MLITAIALFFSTFSTPLLSAALTFGLYIVGHFNADLRNFEQRRRLARRAWLARGLYHVLPDLSAFDVKTEVVHGLPVPVGLSGDDDRLRPHLHRRAAPARDADLFAAGLQVSADRSRDDRCASPRRRVRAWRQRSACRLRAIASMRCASSATERILYVRSGEAVEAARARLRRACGRRLLDPRHPALRRRPAHTAAATAATSCCIRFSI